MKEITVLYGFVAALVILHIFAADNLEKSLIVEEVRLSPHLALFAAKCNGSRVASGDREHASVCKVQRGPQHHPRFRSSAGDKEDERKEGNRTQQKVAHLSAVAS